MVEKYETTHEVWLCNPYGHRLTVIDNLIEFKIVRVVNSPSYCSVTIPSDFDDRFETTIGVDYMVEFWRSPAEGGKQLETVFFVREIIYEEDVKGVDTITLTGPDGIDLLNRRIVAYDAGTSQTQKTDNADDMMKEIVRENLGSSATDSDRDLSGIDFTVAKDDTAGPSITKGFAWRNVLSVLQELSAISEEAGTNLYFDIVPIIINMGVGFEFRTFIDQPGQDRTYDTNNAIIFSKEWGNLEEPVLTFDYDKEINYVYGGGQGEEADRYITEQSDATRIGNSIWNRREGFVDARNESTQTAVQNKTKGALREGQPQARFTANLLDTPQARYGVDWSFGDKVEISYAGLQFQGIVRALKIEMKRGGEEEIKVKVEVIL
jgi:hypothetical protein